mmetsp:Transcript_18879/g.71968  ORF Transcript_18879/g.71968 Transcript_18879/m.71968 type:complete len:224 (+) Transcript_18879:3673-4344(+)
MDWLVIGSWRCHTDRSLGGCRSVVGRSGHGCRGPSHRTACSRFSAGHRRRRKPPHHTQRRRQHGIGPPSFQPVGSTGDCRRLSRSWQPRPQPRQLCWEPAPRPRQPPGSVVSALAAARSRLACRRWPCGSAEPCRERPPSHCGCAVPTQIAGESRPPASQQRPHVARSKPVPPGLQAPHRRIPRPHGRLATTKGGFHRGRSRAPAGGCHQGRGSQRGWSGRRR